MIEAFYQAILNEASPAYACFRIIDGNGSEPADLVLLEASARFSAFFHARFVSIVGRRARELWPDEGGLADLLLAAACSGKPTDLDLAPPVAEEETRLHVFSQDAHYLFAVSHAAVRPEPYRAAASEDRRGTALLSGLGKDLLQHAERHAADIPLRLAETLRTLTGARYSALLIPDSDGDRPGCRTAAITGISPDAHNALNELGIRLENRFWNITPEAIEHLGTSGIRVYPSVSALLRNIHPPAAVLADGLRGVGEAALLPCPGSGAMPAGLFIALMPEGRLLPQNRELLDLFATLAAQVLMKSTGDAVPEPIVTGVQHPIVPALLDSSPDALFLVRAEDGCFRYERINRNALPLFLADSPDAVAGHTPEELFEPSRCMQVVQYMTDCVESGKGLAYEEILTRSGETSCWRTTIVPLPESSGARWLLGTGTDITAQRDPSQSLQNAAQRNEFLLDLLDHSRNFADFLRLVMNRILWLTASTGGAVLLYERTTDTLVPVYVSGMEDALLNQPPSGGIPAGEAGIWAEPVYSGQSCFHAYSEGSPVKPAGNMLLLPVFEFGQTAAVVGIRDKKQSYTKEDALRVTRLLDSVWDAAARLRENDRNRQERDLMKTALSGINEAVVASGSDGRIAWMNGIAAKLTGWVPAQAIGRAVGDVLKLMEEHARVPLDLQAARHTEPDVDNPSEGILLVARDGTTYPVSLSTSLLQADGSCPECIVWTLRDLTDERQRQKNISYLSYHDPLTGIYNRRFFEEELRRLDTRRNLPITLVMSDVNGLKLINDAFGHSMGDKLLRAAADVLRAGCREDDIIARLGGDEYVILLPHTAAAEAEAVISRIREQAAQTQVGTVTLSISFGSETKIDADESMDDIFRRAEDKMYRQKLFESPSMRNNTVKAILQALYETHPMEEAHAHRVARLCEMTGRALGLQEHEVRELRTAGLLHDIGKIAINREIIFKEGALTEEDRWEIRKHSEIGYRILSAVNELAEIADYVLLHHERWDGAGYPKGLKGEAIPLTSRILGLADSYNAMTSDRPYRKALPEAEAIASIRQEAGTKFDPDLVQLFVEQVASKEFVPD